ncbi:MAG: trigger factor [Raoultibacter sp.]
MKITVQEIDDNKKLLVVTVPAQEVTNQIKKGYSSIAYRGQVDPDDARSAKEIALEKLGHEAMQKVLNDLVMNYAIPFALAQEKIRIIGRPLFSLGEMAQEDLDFTFTAEVVLRPSLVLTSYDPVAIVIPKLEVTEQEVDAQVAEIAKNITTQETDTSHDEVCKGDIADLALKTTSGEETLLALTTQSRPYQTGAALMPEDFENEIIGMKVGETKTFDFGWPGYTFGEDGEPIMEVYTTVVTVNRLLKEVVSTVDDDWVNENVPDCATVSDLRRRIEEETLKQKAIEYRHYKNYLCVRELAQRLSGSIPEVVYASARVDMQNSLDAQLQQQGVTREQFLEQKHMSEQQLMADMDKQMHDQLYQQFSLDSLAAHLGLEVEDKDCDEFFAAAAPGQEAQVRTEFETSGRMFSIEENILRLKANDWLSEHAIISIKD